MKMLDETGARRQESLREHPAISQVKEMFGIYCGVIMPNGVRFIGNPSNPIKTTVVDISMFNGMQNIYSVRIARTKISYQTGEEWTPDPGDIVIVAFLAGRMQDPVVIGYLPAAANLIEATPTQVPAGKRRYHRLCNGTELTIDKDGNRILHVQGNDTVTVTGSGTLNVAGNVTINVTGNMTVTTPTCTLNGNLQVNGNIVASGNISDATSKSMAGMRSTFNTHTHTDPQGGTVPAPTQQM